MVTLADKIPDPARFPPLRAMFEARKRVFVDLLKWEVPVVDGRYEVDQFDDEEAAYLIVVGADGGHAGSARLLKTTRPHLPMRTTMRCGLPRPYEQYKMDIGRHI